MRKEVLIINNANDFNLKKLDKKTLLLKWSGPVSYKYKNEISLTDYIEKNSSKIRNIYLQIIQETFSNKLNNKYVYKMFEFNKKLIF